MRANIVDEEDLSPLSISVLQRRMSGSADAPPAPWYRVQGRSEAHLLGQIVFDARRRRPLILVSPHRTAGLLADTAALVSRFGDQADVVEIADFATCGFVEDATDPALAMRGGAVRVVPAGLPARPRGQRDYSFVPERGAGGNATLEWVGKLLDEAGAGSAGGAAPAGPGLAKAKEAKKAADDRVRELERELTRLRKDVQAAQDALAEESRPVFRDPEVQFAHELWLEWLHSTEEDEREHWPLRRWNLCSGFLDSIEAQQVVDRRRVIRACVDVVTGRDAERSSRASHKLRPNRNVSALRNEEGAELWRCWIANKSPSAPRLHWWKLPGGATELASVTLHDDFDNI